MERNTPNLDFEKKLLKIVNLPFIALDEAGRGPLAGPVSVSGVLINDTKVLSSIIGINDSKKLSASKREQVNTQARELIKMKNVMVSNKYIDKNGINTALRKASLEVIEYLSANTEVGFILLDGKHDYIKHPSIKVHTLIKGDSRSLSIALASINAKISRDRKMISYSKNFPEYKFEDNMGYGTKRHIQAIKEFGACKLHRNSYLGNIIE